MLASPGIASDKSADDRSFKTELSGNEEVPPVKTKAVGTAAFQISEGGDRMTYMFTISNIKDITGAFIAKGKKGENGPIVIDLFKEPGKEDISGIFLAKAKSSLTC